jgi:hypothetical protein
MRGPGFLLAAAAASLCASSASALDLPARKVGLWEIKMTTDARGAPATTMQQCIDAETDKMMSALGNGMQQSMCSKQDVQKTGSTIVVDSVCQIGQMTTTSHAVVTGDFNSAYTVKVTSTHKGAMAPGMPAQDTMNMTLAATWMGACKADQKPGDIIMPGGRKMNIRDLQKHMPAAKKYPARKERAARLRRRVTRGGPAPRAPRRPTSLPSRRTAPGDSRAIPGSTRSPLRPWRP